MPSVTYGLPVTTCIIVIEAIAHGIPVQRQLAKGDLVNISISA
ncbi:hypothetical protein [Paracoccus sp. R86501]